MVDSPRMMTKHYRYEHIQKYNIVNNEKWNIYDNILMCLVVVISLGHLCDRIYIASHLDMLHHQVITKFVILYYSHL